MLNKSGFAVLVSLAALAGGLYSGSSAAEGVLDRWKKKVSAEESDSGAGAGAGTGGAAGNEPIFGGATGPLKVNQKVPLMVCRANPYSCLCPSGSVRTEFWESTNWEEAPKKTMMCIRPDCPTGKKLKKKVSIAGVTEFICATPGKWQ